MVMERKLKRRLVRGEVVHHIDHNRTNNDDTNLEVMPSQRYHVIHHSRRPGSESTQGADEPNVRIRCACGCGRRIWKYNRQRLRRFVLGHNSRLRPKHPRIRPKKIRQKKTHCPQGHPYVPENLLAYHLPQMKCKTCHRNRERKRKR